MNFHPILFTSEMIRANLEGRKTQTRRVVMPQPEPWQSICDLQDGTFARIGEDYESLPFRCPYGVPGDVLWARETWATDHKMFYPCFPVVYAADGSPASHEIVKGRVYSPEVKDWFPFRWRPSIHMPKWACRLWCRVESVRVQRVQEITLADCAAEGAPPTHDADQVWDSTDTYRKLWNRINEGRGFGWKANPWVWAITYTPMRTGEHGWAEYCQK